MAEPDEFKARWTGVFSRAAAAYDRTGPHFFSHFGRRLVEFAAIPPGSRVLDVACGRGAVFVPASAAAGPSGHVTATDLAEGMVEQARQEVSRQGLSNVTVLQMDAENLDFPDASFDFVLAGLCLFFLPDLDRALAGFHRVLKPGGRLVASTFESHDDPLEQRVVEIRKAFRDQLKPVAMVETKNLATEAQVKEAFSQAGFAEVEVKRDAETFYYDNLEEWWATGWSTGARAYLERLNPDALPKYREQILAAVAETKTEKGYPEEWRMLLSKARKAG